METQSAKTFVCLCAPAATSSSSPNFRQPCLVLSLSFHYLFSFLYIFNLFVSLHLFVSSFLLLFDRYSRSTFSLHDFFYFLLPSILFPSHFFLSSCQCRPIGVRPPRWAQTQVDRYHGGELRGCRLPDAWPAPRPPCTLTHTSPQGGQCHCWHWTHGCLGAILNLLIWFGL